MNKTVKAMFFMRNTACVSLLYSNWQDMKSMYFMKGLQRLLKGRADIYRTVQETVQYFVFSRNVFQR